MARDRFALASVGLAAALLSGVAHGVPTTAATGAFEDVRVAPYGAEAAITTGPDDTLYLAIPGSDGPDFFRSADQGRTWIQGATADTRDGAGGDNGLATDSAGAIYEVNSGVLSYSSDGRRDEILGADVYRSINGGSSWPQRGRSILDQGSNTLPQDRPWVGAWLPPGDRPADTRVYLVYKDVVTSEIWVVRSRDAGAHFGAPILVSASPLAFQAAACSAYPGGVRVVQSGPHAGRVYIAWTGGDIATNASTGCYFTMLNTEHTVWVSWSDDGGLTWVNHLVYEALPGHDTSAVFARLALDTAGNPYVAFAGNLRGEYDIYVESSFDGGRSWNGGRLGLAPPVQASVGPGTHLLPAIAAGDPGMVDVAYVATPTLVPVLPYGKPAPGAGRGAIWNVYVSQTLDIRSGAPWQTFAVSPQPMHVGDVCIEGSFCTTDFNKGDRSLFEYVEITLDRLGFAHVAYRDTQQQGLYVGNQIAGPAVIR